MRAPRMALLGIALVAAAGCTSLRYYSHVTHGQLALLAAREPVARIVADPAADPALREQLAGAQAAREFASARLHLPRNRSYASYVALDRPYATWNVFAAPEFSVEPLTHCMPFAGCVPYLGYFDEAPARAAAARLAAQGNDTAVVGSAAYSTLGWFADPILSSMLRPGDELAGVIFHELAHQQLYVKDDATFNESWASFVQAQGVREWRVARGLEPRDDHAIGQREEGFIRLVLDLREQLRRLYASNLDAGRLRHAKAHAFEGFRQRHRAWRDARAERDAARDAWVEGPLGNADLLPFGIYDRWKLAFAALFERKGGDWPAFLACASELSRMPRAAREDLLRALEARTHGGRIDACPRATSLRNDLRGRE
ncbi:MAG TPA: aminopeptidase [Dokdonella sp.]